MPAEGSVAEYRVELKRSAEKELAKLPDDVLARIVAKLEKQLIPDRMVARS